ncbi:hypothetical protein KP509_02G114400 [Ceratopteris richardii]|uniref:HHO5-like N-terminal domain-containing protein n=1 Tax=Ceratopteris richardii TaxID=49495 RepID=A0A8T2VI15_CERRI|nr:hypothetical protein KP509_02G114400 [Ceratopteris richardii]
MPMPSLLAEDLCLGYKHTRAATDQKENKAYELRTNVKGEVFSDSSVVATSVPLNAPSGLRELEAYHKALQEERVKIKAFGRELPFCLQLLLDDDDGHAYSLEDEIVEINVYNDKKKTAFQCFSGAIVFFVKFLRAAIGRALQKREQKF